ncbi:MAG: DNA polymerase I [Anaerolineae bacterium]|nr:MAG: DNA polymerase I [Anaerolineae bacterium]
MPETLYLIDGHALAYRTYFALTGAGGNTSRWNTSKGEPTAGIFGFTSVLLRLLEQERPDYLMVAFDVGATFRDELFPEYKGTREKMPDDLRSQIERMRELVDAFNIPRLEMDGYEADDVLGSIAQKAAKQGLGVKIITGDRDLLQLVAKRIFVSLPGKKLADSTDYNAENVKEVFGVEAGQIVDYKALVGDTSDNIPGVAGIGQKTAEKLLADYGSLDKIYAHLDELPAGQRTKLAEGKENAYLSQKLARIITDLDIPLDLEKGRIRNFDPETVQALFRELEFRSLMGRLNTVMQLLGMAEPPLPPVGQQIALFGGETAAVEAPPATNIDLETIIVDTPELMASMVKALSKAKMIAFDCETTGVDQMLAELVGISLATNGEKGYYIPVAHKAGEQLPLEDVLEALKGPLTNPDIPKVAHNAKYDYVVLRRYGLDVQPVGFDTMIGEWLVHPDSRNLGLKDLAWVRLDIQMTKIEELIGKGKKQITMAEVPIEYAAPYAAADAAITYRLVEPVRKDVKKAKADGLLEDIEMPLVLVLAEMEMNGIALDEPFLSGMSGELQQRLGEIDEQVYKMVGYEFNLNSTQKLSQALFETLKLTPPEGTTKTASGHYSTAAGVLEEMEKSHPVVALLLEQRELSKLKSTYVDALPTQVNPATGRVHTSYSQTGVVTGRISSNNPNLQNIPIRTELGRKVRQAFIAEPGNLLVAADYSQVELRIVAHMADDEAMIQAFLEDQDIHAATAAAIYGIKIKDVDSDMRRHAKAINFGLIYGMSAFGLTRTTDLTLAEAEDFVKAYFDRFTGVKAFLEKTRKHALEKEFVETLLGRRRYFHGLGTQSNQLIRNRMLREAINSPVQGTAADIMKLAMLEVQREIDAGRLKARMLLQVHDELVLECAEKDAKKVGALVQAKMAEAYALKVPLKTEARAGINWGKMTPL